MKVAEKEVDLGIAIDAEKFVPGNRVELFGHVTLVRGYDVPGFEGCHALVKLRDVRQTVAVVTSELKLQNLLQTALATQNLIAFNGYKLRNPPSPLGGRWNVDVYGIYSIILYSMK